MGIIALVKSLITSKELPVSTGTELLGVNRTSVYYKGTPVSQWELDAKGIIDSLHTEHPTWGSRQISKQLQARGFKIGRKKTRRFMTEMARDPIYPKLNLSKAAKGHKVYPYLLRNFVATAPNQAWSIDIILIQL